MVARSVLMRRVQRAISFGVRCIMRRRAGVDLNARGDHVNRSFLCKSTLTYRMPVQYVQCLETLL